MPKTIVRFVLVTQHADRAAASHIWSTYNKPPCDEMGFNKFCLIHFSHLTINNQAVIKELYPCDTALNSCCQAHLKTFFFPVTTESQPFCSCTCIKEDFSLQRAPLQLFCSSLRKLAEAVRA